jgi:hypothetical protein
VDLSAPPLVPIAVLALASSGQVGAPAPAEREATRVPAGILVATTPQKRPLSIRVREGGRRAGWRIGYVARCEDGTVIRGRYVSGSGTPLLDIGPGGRFRLSRTEPAEFKGEGTGTARFTFSGRLARDGGSGSWRLTLVTPPGEDGRVACTVGPLEWQIKGG